MIRSLFTAVTGMKAQELNIDVMANNLANVNTVGFKRSRADFQDLLYQTLREAGSASSANTQLPTGLQVGLGSRPVSVQKLFTQGDFQPTERSLDWAIEGDGFFQITQPNGELAYTRAGSLKTDSQGRVVNSDGYVMDPQITIPSDAVSISVGADGTVSVVQAGQTTSNQVGNILLAKFANPTGLKALGRNLYVSTEASGTATTGTPGQVGFGTIAQGFLEQSNVSIVEELTQMIVAQRAYEVNSKAVQSADEMLQTANNMKR